MAPERHPSPTDVVAHAVRSKVERIFPCRPTIQESALHLAELDPGKKATVTGVAQGEAFCHLCGLGVIAGAEIEVVRHLSKKTMLIVRVDGSDMALRDGTAMTVMVRPE